MRSILQILNHTCTASKRDELLNNQMSGKIHACLPTWDSYNYYNLTMARKWQGMKNNLSVLQLYSYVYS